MTTTKTYTVTGMTCSHCVNAVSAEIGSSPASPTCGSTWPPERSTVTSEQPVDDDAVAAAVDEAGYEVAR